MSPKDSTRDYLALAEKLDGWGRKLHHSWDCDKTNCVCGSADLTNEAAAALREAHAEIAGWSDRYVMLEQQAIAWGKQAEAAEKKLEQVVVAARSLLDSLTEDGLASPRSTQNLAAILDQQEDTE